MFKNEPLLFEPGSKYDYSNSGYLLLGYIVERLTHKRFIDYLKERIFEPLGMKDSGFCYHWDIVPEKASGYDKTENGLQVAEYIDMRIAGGGGGLYSTVEDIHKFNDGLLEGKIISLDLLEKMFTSHTEIIESTGYGYGFFIAKRKFEGKTKKVNYHTGGGPGIRTINALYLDEDIQVIVLSNLNDRDMFNNVYNEIEQLIYPENKD